MSRFSISGWVSRAFFVLLLPAAFAAGRAATADDAPRPDVVSAPTADLAADSIQDLLFCAPRRPFLIRLHLVVGGKGFRAIHRNWADTQFIALDADKNGFLAGAELAGIPALRALWAQGEPNQAKFPDADSDPADGKVSPVELQEYLLNVTGTRFSIQLGQDSVSRWIDLFPMLDQNQDGKLSPQELGAASEQLLSRDLNEDDVLSAEELRQNPQRNPDADGPPAALGLDEQRNAARRQLEEVLGLIAIVDPARGSAVARRLIQGYDKSSRDPLTRTFRKDEQLSPAELAIAPEEFRRADRNGDGRLDRGELAELAAFLEPAIELAIRDAAADGAPAIELLRKPAADLANLIGAEHSAKGQAHLQLAGVSLALRVGAPPAGLEKQIRETYLASFRTFDRDSSDDIDAVEAQRFGDLFRTFCRRADTDGDGKVNREEYSAQLDRELAFSKSSVSMTISSVGHSLFRLIDSNEDDQLSIRELRDVLAKSSKWDADGDRLISREELAIPPEAVVFFGMPRVNGPFNVVVRPTPGQPENHPAPPGGETVPAWFTRMDANRDGDVSLKEFVGSRPLFDKFDRNRDGLISSEEAIESWKEAAKQR